MSSSVDNQELEYKKINAELKTEISKLADALNCLEDDINVLISGDTKGSYWSGHGAYNVLKGCITQIEHNKDLLPNLEKCSSYVDSLVNK